MKFTGKERDAEAGLDYFGARYMSGGLGRFIGPDAPFADQFPSDPQSWNLYGYVRNNPLRNVDVDGNASQAAELVRFGMQATKIPGPTAVAGAGMVLVGGIAAYASDSDFRDGVNRGIDRGVKAFVDAAPNTSMGDPAGIGLINDHIYLNQNQSASGDAPPPAKSNSNSTPADPDGKEPKISRQQQDAHVSGTKENARRGDNPSTFFGQKSGDKWTQKAYKDGTPVPGRPDQKVLSPGVSTGTGPNGGMQKQVKVHIKKNGKIHGNPSGPEHN